MLTITVIISSPKTFVAIKAAHIKKMLICHSFIVSVKLLATTNFTALSKFKVFTDHSDYCYC